MLRFPYEPQHSGSFIHFFNKILCKCKLDRYILFILLRTAQFPAQLSPEFMFHTEWCTDHATGICRQGRTDVNLGVVRPLFSFLVEIHYKYKLYIYTYNLRYVRKPYLERLGPMAHSFVRASTTRRYRSCDLDLPAGMDR